MSLDPFDSQSIHNSSLRHSTRSICYKENNAESLISQYVKFIHVVEELTQKHRQSTNVSQKTQKCAKFYKTELQNFKTSLISEGKYNLSAEQLFDKQTQLLNRIINAKCNQTDLNFDQQNTQSQSMEKDTTGFGSFDFNNLTHNNFGTPEINYMENNLAGNNNPMIGIDQYLQNSYPTFMPLSSNSQNIRGIKRVAPGNNANDFNQKYFKCQETPSALKSLYLNPKSVRYGGKDLSLIESSIFDEGNEFNENKENSPPHILSDSLINGFPYSMDSYNGIHDESTNPITQLKEFLVRNTPGEVNYMSNGILHSESQIESKTVPLAAYGVNQTNFQETQMEHLNDPELDRLLAAATSGCDFNEFENNQQLVAIYNDMVNIAFNDRTTLLDTIPSSQGISNSNRELQELELVNTNKLLRVLMLCKPNIPDDSVLNKAYSLVQKSFHTIAMLVELRCNAIRCEIEEQNARHVEVTNPFSYKRSNQIQLQVKQGELNDHENKATRNAYKLPQELPMVDGITSEFNEPIGLLCPKRADWRSILLECNNLNSGKSSK